MKDYTKLTDAEKKALLDKIAQVAHDTEYSYGSCAQSCLKALKEAFPDMGITDELFTASYGLAGGCGCSLEGTCGALNGAALAVSACIGRPENNMDGDYSSCYEKIRDLVAPFKAKYNGVRCGDVMTTTLGAVYDFKTEEGEKGYMDHDGDEHCAQAVVFAATMVANLILNGEL